MRSLSTSRQKLSRVTALMLLLLTALLSSCGAEPPIPTPCPAMPSAYLGHLDKTGFSGKSYGDVAQYAVILKRERDMCLNRIDKIREWQAENTQN